MALKSGLAASIGFGDEVTAGVAVAPTVHTPFRDESLESDLSRLQSEAIYYGRRFVDTDQRNGGPIDVGGDIGLELQNRVTAKLLKYCIGGVVTTGSGPYTHTITPGDLVPFTAQVGIPAIDGTRHPKTVSGCKVESWELDAQVGEIATLGVSVAGMVMQIGSRTVADGVTTNGSATVTSASAAFTEADAFKSISGTGIPTGAYIRSVTNGTTIVLSANATADGTGLSLVIGKALAAVSQPSDIKPFKFTHGLITVAGAEAELTGFNLNVDNGLATDRRKFGNPYRKEPLEAALRSGEVTLDGEFESLSHWNRIRTGEDVAIVASFTSGTDAVTITQKVEFDAGTPMVADAGIVQQSITAMCVGEDTDASALTVVVVNGDSAA